MLGQVHWSLQRIAFGNCWSRCPASHPTNSVKALNGSRKQQSKEWYVINSTTTAIFSDIAIINTELEWKCVPQFEGATSWTCCLLLLHFCLLLFLKLNNRSICGRQSIKCEIQSGLIFSSIMSLITATKWPQTTPCFDEACHTVPVRCDWKK